MRGSCSKIEGKIPRTKLRIDAKLGPKPALIAAAGLLVLIEVGGLALSSPSLAQSQPLEQPPGVSRLPKTASPLGDAVGQQTCGTVSGRVVDPTGKGIARADVNLLRDQESPIDEVQSDEDGRFTFTHAFPGPLRLRIIAEGFGTEVISGTLRPGENYGAPLVTLSLATQVTEIHVSPPSLEIAQEQFKDLQKQRVLGVIPNFYVSYVGGAEPLTPNQKFHLALKATTDPVSATAVGVIAGVNQASNRFSGYGQGSEGYAKRYGASYANFASGLFIGGAVLPSIFKQDPRYFLQGDGDEAFPVSLCYLPYRDL